MAKNEPKHVAPSQDQTNPNPPAPIIDPADNMPPWRDQLQRSADIVPLPEEYERDEKIRRERDEANRAKAAEHYRARQEGRPILNNDVDMRREPGKTSAGPEPTKEPKNQP